MKNDNRKIAQVGFVQKEEDIRAGEGREQNLGHMTSVSTRKEEIQANI